MDKIKKLFQSNDSKRGSYTLAMTSIVIAIVIIFNMIVNLIPENKRQFDISSTNIYEISSKSEKIIKKVDDDVTFYVLAEKDRGLRHAGRPQQRPHRLFVHPGCACGRQHHQ